MANINVFIMRQYNESIIVWVYVMSPEMGVLSIIDRFQMPNLRYSLMHK